MNLLTFLHSAFDHGPDVLALLVDAPGDLDEQLHVGLLDEAAAAQRAVLHVLLRQLLGLGLLQGLDLRWVL